MAIRRWWEVFVGDEVSGEPALYKVVFGGAVVAGAVVVYTCKTREKK